MSNDDLRTEIKEMMVENLMLKVSKEEIADDMPLFGPEGLGLDSIDALELVVSLEKKFGVSVPDSETAKTRSEEHTSELQSRENLVCRLLLEKKNEISCR